MERQVLQPPWIEVSEVTPLAQVFGPEWRATPPPPRSDVRWRVVFGYDTLASRVINYVVNLANAQTLTTLGALAEALRATYFADLRFGKGIGALGTAYLLTALEIIPPSSPPATAATAGALRRAARQLRVVAASVQEQVTPDTLAALERIQQTLRELCTPAV
ncbi:MAG TPA: hypothetical protein PKH77_00815 [Anaerolineae bacterium]|nr:hypothetical protein [Anaerolineae bacterium]